MIDFESRKNELHKKHQIDELINILKNNDKLLAELSSCEEKENKNVIIKNFREKIKLSTNINKLYLYCCFLREFLQNFYDSETISSETYYVFSIIELDFETFITNNIKMPDNSKLAPIRENYIINSIELLDKINDYIIKGYELNDLKLTISIYNYLFSSQELDSEINKKVVFVSGE